MGGGCIIKPREAAFLVTNRIASRATLVWPTMRTDAKTTTTVSRRRVHKTRAKTIPTSMLNAVVKTCDTDGKQT